MSLIVGRFWLASGVLAGTASVAGAAPYLSLLDPTPDLMTDEGNMLAGARMDGDLDESNEKFGSATGIVSAVRTGEAVRDLFGCEVFSAGCIRRQPDGSFRFLHRETIYYTDLVSGEIITEYLNHFTNEMVTVVDVANDPWNEKIEAFAPEVPSYGGLIKEAPVRKPFLMNWSMGFGGVAVATTHINLYYPATLKSDKWPRESSGPMNQVSENLFCFMPLPALRNPRL